MVIKLLILVAVVLVSVLLYRKRRKKPKEENKSEEEMPVGMQIKDEYGNILYDFSSETFHVFGHGTIFGGVSGSITDSRIRANDTILLPLVQTMQGFDVNDYNTSPPRKSYQYQEKVYSVFPDIKIEDGKISWSFRTPSDSRGYYVGVEFVYGGRLF